MFCLCCHLHPPPQFHCQLSLISIAAASSPSSLLLLLDLHLVESSSSIINWHPPVRRRAACHRYGSNCNNCRVHLSDSQVFDRLTRSATVEMHFYSRTRAVRRELQTFQWKCQRYIIPNIHHPLYTIRFALNLSASISIWFGILLHFMNNIPTTDTH